MGRDEIEEKVMEQLSENHKETLKKLNPDEESILELEQPKSQPPETDINEIR